MWLFNKKKTLPQQGIFHNFTDNHSHILPGVDDGVPTLQQSLQILQTYETLGIQQVILTPHIQEYLPNTTQFLTSEFQKLLQAYTGPITLHLSAEYMLDNLLLQRLHTHDLLFHNSGSLDLRNSGSQELPNSRTPELPRSRDPESPRSILLETSYLSPPINFKEILHEVQSQGIQPILAHPERYLYMTHEDYHRLHDQGILFQLNLPSLLGLYGKHPQRRAHYLLSHNLISLLGTDIHSPNLLPLLQSKKIPLLR